MQSKKDNSTQGWWGRLSKSAKALYIATPVLLGIIISLDEVSKIFYQWLYPAPVFETACVKTDPNGNEFKQAFTLEHPQCEGCEVEEAIPYGATFTLSDSKPCKIYDVRVTKEINASFTWPALASRELASIQSSKSFRIDRYSQGPPGSIEVTAFYEKEIDVCVKNCPDSTSTVWSQILKRVF